MQLKQQIKHMCMHSNEDTLAVRDVTHGMSSRTHGALHVAAAPLQLMQTYCIMQ
jgi:hypothetical protein